MAPRENAHLGSNMTLISSCRLFVLHQFNRLSHLCLSLRLRPLPRLPLLLSLFHASFLCLIAAGSGRLPPPSSSAIQLPTAGESSRAAIVRVLNGPNAGLDGHQTRRRNKGAIVDWEINLANPPLLFLCEEAAVVGGHHGASVSYPCQQKDAVARRRTWERLSPGSKGGI